MIERYSRKAMSEYWTVEARFSYMLKVEIAVAEAQAQFKLIPAQAAKAIKKKARFDVKRILEIEKTTKHDVIAFVSNLAENVGAEGRYIHFGMTSSDVLDTAFSLQVIESSVQLLNEIQKLKGSLKTLIINHKSTLCAGRTHGMFAEPTTFGFKMAGFYSELIRNEERLIKAFDQFSICKLSGAVGTYSSQSIQVEKEVARQLKLQVEPLATQVIPRDRHAEVLLAMALLAAGYERLAIELRHLQRSDVGEVIEGFTSGQKGSSAMPHKKNPISAENLTGLARLMKSYAQVGLDNVPLWHERDISHSSAERVVFPDAFVLADYMTDRLNTLVSHLHVDRERMLKNIDASQGQLFSSHVLLALVDSGLSREEAYKVVQRLSHGLKQGEHLKEALENDFETKNRLKKKVLEEIFSGKRHIKETEQVIKKVLMLQPKRKLK